MDTIRDHARALLALCDRADREAAERERADALAARNEELAGELEAAEAALRASGEEIERLQAIIAAHTCEPDAPQPPEAPENPPGEPPTDPPEPTPDPEPEAPEPNPEPPEEPPGETPEVPTPEVPEGFTPLAQIGVHPEVETRSHVARDVAVYALPSLHEVGEDGRAPEAAFRGGELRGVLPHPNVDTSEAIPVDVVRDGAVALALLVLSAENAWGECPVVDREGAPVGRFAWEVGAFALSIPAMPDGATLRVPRLPYRTVETGPDYSREIAEATASGVRLWHAGGEVHAAPEVAPDGAIRGVGEAAAFVAPEGHAEAVIRDSAKRRVRMGEPLPGGFSVRGVRVVGTLHRTDWSRVTTYPKGLHGIETDSGRGHRLRDVWAEMCVGDGLYAGGRPLLGPLEPRAVRVARDGLALWIEGLPFDEGLRGIDGREPTAFIEGPDGTLFVIGPATHKRGNLAPILPAALPPEARTYDMALGWIRVQTGEATMTNPLPLSWRVPGAVTARVKTADQSACEDFQVWNATVRRTGRALWVFAAVDNMPEGAILGETVETPGGPAVRNGGGLVGFAEGRCWEFLRLPGSKNKAGQFTSLRCANPKNRGIQHTTHALSGISENGATVKTERGQEPLAGRHGHHVIDRLTVSAYRGRAAQAANPGVGPVTFGEVIVDGSGGSGLAVSNSRGFTLGAYTNTSPRPDHVDIAVNREAGDVDLPRFTREVSVRRGDTEPDDGDD